MRVSSEMFYTAEPFYKEPTQHCPMFFSKAHAISIPISYFLWADYLNSSRNFCGGEATCFFTKWTQMRGSCFLGSGPGLPVMGYL